MKLKIRQDDDPVIHPRRDFGNLGTMVCWHRRYVLGDVQPSETPEEYIAEHLPPEDLEGSVMMPLYLLDHSGITIRTEPFNDPWDSGQVGWIYVRAERIKEEYGDCSQESLQKARECLLAEVKVYDQYLRGAVWGWEYGDDSCWGFYGDDLEETGIKDSLPEAALPFLEEAWEARG